MAITDSDQYLFLDLHSRMIPGGHGRPYVLSGMELGCPSTKYTLNKLRPQTIENFSCTNALTQTDILSNTFQYEFIPSDLEVY